MKNLKFVAILAATLLFQIGTSAQQAPQVPIDPQVRIGHLDNGLTYYIRHNSEPAGQVHFYIAQKVGSILEDEEQRGLAHFLEHMCFNGTEHFPGNGLIKYLETIGVKFGADLNAYTSIDETVYNIDKVPVNVPGAIDSCLWILHDWADGLLLEGEDIDKERGVIHEEWRSRQNAMMRMYEQILPIIYPDNNRYGQRMPIGLTEVIDNFPHQAIRDYYEKWYRPDQQGIVVVGDIDVDQIEGKIKDIFNTIAKPENPAERFYVQIPDNKEPIVAMAKDKEQPYAYTYIFKKHDAWPDEMKNSLNYLVSLYVNNLISMMTSQRIVEMAMKPNPPFLKASIGDDNFFLAKTKKAFTGVAITSEEGLATGAAAVYREMLRIARHGFTAGEFERAKAEFAVQLESMYKEREKTKSVSYCKEYYRHFIDNEPIPGIENEYAIYNQVAPGLTVEMVNQYVASLCGPDNLVVACMLPDKEGVTYPDVEGMKKIFADVEAEDIAPYVDQANNEPLVAELPAPGKIVSTKDAKFGYTLYTLSNGAKVYLRSTDFKADQIIMRASSPGGTSLYSDSEALDLKVASGVFTLGGVGNFNITGLNKVLAGKKASVSPFISTYSEGMSGSSTPKDFETMMQLTYLYFTAHRADDEAFQSYKDRSKASLKNAEVDPSTALNDTITAVVYKNHPRVTSLKVGDIDNINYERIMEIAGERFSNIGDFTFIFTGNIDEETALPLIEQYIGGIPANGKKEKYKDTKIRKTKGINETAFDKEMEVPKATVLLLDSGKGKFDLKNNLCSNIAAQILRIIYTEEIREKEGGTYGVGVKSSLSMIPKPEESIQISFETDPDKYEYLTGRIEEILKDFAKNGPSEENLNKIKEYMQKNFTESQKENSYFSSTLSNYLESGIDFHTDYEKTLASITTEDIRDYVAKLLKQGNSTKVVMKGIEKK